MEDATHIITINVTGRYPHGKEHEHAQVRIAGDGGADHFIEAFKTAMVAAGFSTEAARKLEQLEF